MTKENPERQTGEGPGVNENGGNRTEDRVILVVGACGLDRTLSVPRFPLPDSKIRTDSTYENGGGNAANTASALALLADSSFVKAASKKPIRVRLLTKIGTDAIGDALCRELESASVDLSSPLFVRVGGSSTTTVIVDGSQHTRTCIHSPGTCGELTAGDVARASMDDVFRNVVHFHSDCRHTEAAAMLAREACRRGIPVSVDAERDRGRHMDELLKAADIVFTNQNQLGDYLERQARHFGEQSDGDAKSSSFTGGGGSPGVGSSRSILLPRPTSPMTPGHSLDGEFGEYVRAARLCHHFRRRYGSPSKEVIITKGEAGALHVRHYFHQRRRLDGGDARDADVVRYDEVDQTVTVHDLVRSHHSDVAIQWGGEAAAGRRAERFYDIREDKYRVRAVGSLRDVTVRDTTGAGDSFIAGYVISYVAQGYEVGRGEGGGEFNFDLALMFASWVAGRSVQGYGTRSSLPSGTDVDKSLGCDDIAIWQCLKIVLRRPKRRSK